MDAHPAWEVMVAVRFTLSVADYINKHSVSSVFRIDLLGLEVIVQEQRCLPLLAMKSNNAPPINPINNVGLFLSFSNTAIIVIFYVFVILK